MCTDVCVSVCVFVSSIFLWILPNSKLLEIITNSDQQHGLEFECNQGATLVRGTWTSTIARIDSKFHSYQIKETIYVPLGLETVASFWWCCRLFTWLCSTRFWRCVKYSACDAESCDVMNGGWMGRRLGMAGRIFPLVGPMGLNLEGLKMSMTLKLVSFVGLSSSSLLLLFGLFSPLSLLDMLRGWHCWLLLLCDDGSDGDSLWFCDLITEFKCSPLELGFWLSLGFRMLLLWWWWWLIFDAAVKCEFLWWLKWPWPLKECDDVILLRGDVTQVLIPRLSRSCSEN